MITSEQINTIVEDYLEGTDKFVVKLTLSKDNLINLFIDGDNGITIDDCVKLSRHIEDNFDRDEEDFELRVSSAGIDLPYVNLRQYVKNIGRKIQVKLKDDSIKRGELVSANAEKIEVIKDVKGKGKSKKIIPGDKLEIPMSEILEAKSIIVI